MLLAFRFFFLQLFNFENDSNITSTQQNTPSIIYICRFNEFRSNFFSIYLYLKSGWVNIFAFFRSDNYGLTFQWIKFNVLIKTKHRILLNIPFFSFFNYLILTIILIWLPQKKYFSFIFIIYIVKLLNFAKIFSQNVFNLKVSSLIYLHSFASVIMALLFNKLNRMDKSGVLCLQSFSNFRRVFKRRKERKENNQRTWDD